MRVGGMAEKMGEAFKEFGLVTLVAILLTYLLLAAIMESWTQPLIILMTVPFSALGSTGAAPHADEHLHLALLAGIMLVGVVVNAAILLIDEVNVLRRDQGYHKRDALLMALSEVPADPDVVRGGALRHAADGHGDGVGLLRASIGIGSVGGILISSALSLYFIPAFYLVMGQSDKAQDRKIKRDLDKMPDPAVTGDFDLS